MSVHDLPSRATGTLALVSRDPAARERFLAAYRGPSDGMAVLRRVAGFDDADREQARADRLDALKRRAYARPTDAEQQREAARARQSLIEIAERDRAEADALEAALDELDRVPAAPVVPAPSVPAIPTPGPGATEHPRPRLAPRYLLVGGIAAAVLAVAAIVVGVTGTHENTVAENPTATPTTHPTPDPTPGPAAASSPIGDLPFAYRWLEWPQTGDDPIPADFMPDFQGSAILADTAHLLGRSDDGWAWRAAEGTGGLLCLIGSAETPQTQDAQQVGVSACIDAENFRKAGVTLTEGNVTATWNGDSVTFSTSIAAGADSDSDSD